MREIALPDFPWDTLAPYGDKARAYPGGIVDLSIGTPVDSTPEVVQEAVRKAADAPGYPPTIGIPPLRSALVEAAERLYGITGLTEDMVLPVIGTKEFIGTLPTLLGIGAGDTVMIPELAYPTYAVSAAFAGAESIAADGYTRLGPAPVALCWVNSPSNPTGRVLGADHLRKMVDESRRRGTILASDECYLDLYYGDERPLSVLHPDVRGDSFDGVLAVHSLSKRSNFAGLRGGFVMGDPALISRLTEVRKHLGFLVPRPVQEAMIAAYSDDAHVEQQRARYAQRRRVLSTALIDAGFTIDHSEAGLYLWSTRGEDCWETVDFLATRGILVAPGSFYGPTGAQHVRVALTGTDDAIAEAARRLRAS
ncbi:succinyldiaminopimelate transaminase [Epidermidibacterium keratini]|uniref:Succinyldiaminopimelate transaminase n=1 Tax=Epidermidibacterium keratini TaxID=1891644 RepID=A0A7L4YLD9_9ACTN|nr:succinyldiaminopimelate transaminase [Epidermidibacterium keratini]QHB99648.1 succinyldiaminopimelate transaminase [Epidermidibacterium keratini]